MTTADPTTSATAAAAARAYLMPTYPVPAVTFVRGLGSYLYDVAGMAYLDFVGGLAVTSLGHSHPAVAAALAAQSQTLLHVSNLFGTTVASEVAATLNRLLESGEGGVFFANSGAEANECAIKLARKWAGEPGQRYTVVSALNSFHGRTLATLHATGQAAKHQAFQPLPQGFRHVAYGDLAAMEAALDPTVVAAVLLETLQGETGVNEAPAAYFTGVQELCRRRRILLMIDEVQTGLGRTGRWFGFQHFGLQPDVVTMAKALGNGVPIGACWARTEIASAFVAGDHGTTFGGQPLAAAAARAVLAVMEAEDVPARAEKAGDRLRSGLLSLPGVGPVRGLGLLLAAELVGRSAMEVTAAALRRGLVLNAVTPTAIRLAPSLLVTDDEIDEALAILEAVLTEPADGAPS